MRAPPDSRAHFPRSGGHLFGDSGDTRQGQRSPGALNTIVTSAVGTGLTPRAGIDRELLGLTEEQAGAWEAHAARIWAWWAETPACDVTGRFDFSTLQALVLVSRLESGDVLAVRRRKERRARLLRLTLQLLEADYLSNPQFGPDTDRLAGGVEINQLGEPVRCHLASRPAGGLLGRGGLTRAWFRLPPPESDERLVRHIFDPIRPGQTSGIPLSPRSSSRSSRRSISANDSSRERSEATMPPTQNPASLTGPTGSPLLTSHFLPLTFPMGLGRVELPTSRLSARISENPIFPSAQSNYSYASRPPRNLGRESSRFGPDAEPLRNPGKHRAAADHPWLRSSPGFRSTGTSSSTTKPSS
ncbi:MAG: phage portal protein [Gemmatimonadales bacterium]